MPNTRDDIELIGHIKTALRDVHDPCTVEELIQNCRELRRRPDKVKQCLLGLRDSGIVEHYGVEYMLTENVTDLIRHEWLNRVFDREENLNKRKLSSSLSYAEVASKRRESAPAGLGGACGTPEQKVYKRSASDVHPGTSTTMNAHVPAVQEDRPVEQPIFNHVEQHHHEHQHHHHNHFNVIVNCPEYKDCDFSSNERTVINAGDNNQIGNQNQMSFVSPKRKPKGKRNK